MHSFTLLHVNRANNCKDAREPCTRVYDLLQLGEKKCCLDVNISCHKVELKCKFTTTNVFIKWKLMQLLCSCVKNMEKWKSGGSLKMNEEQHDYEKRLSENASIDFPFSDCEYISQATQKACSKCSLQTSRFAFIMQQIDKHLHFNSENVLRTRNVSIFPRRLSHANRISIECKFPSLTLNWNWCNLS